MTWIYRNFDGIVAFFAFLHLLSAVYAIWGRV